MIKFKPKNRYTKWPSRKNFVAFKKQNNFCNNLSKRIKKKYFTKSASNGVTENKHFWNAVKRFQTSQGFLDNDNRAANFDKKTIKSDKKISKS